MTRSICREPVTIETEDTIDSLAALIETAMDMIAALETRVSELEQSERSKIDSNPHP